jgi:hypothetical protein
MGVSWTKETISNSGTAGTTTAESLTIDSIKIDGTTIGHTSDTDLLSFASGTLTVNGQIAVGANDEGHNVTFYGDTSGAYLKYNATQDRLDLVEANTSMSAEGPIFRLIRSNATSDGDELGSIKYIGNDVTYAKITAEASETGSTESLGTLRLEVMADRDGGEDPTVYSGLKLIGRAVGDANALIDVTIPRGDLHIESTKKIYFDSGNNTYITESGADVLDFYAGGTNMLKLTESGTNTIVINSGTGSTTKVSGQFSCNNQTPAAAPTYTATSQTARNADTATADAAIQDVLQTLIADLIAIGLLQSA